MPVRGSTLKGALATTPRGRSAASPSPIGRSYSMPLNMPGVANAAAETVAGMSQGAGLQRLSPGVYRNPQGGLVNSQGSALPGQRQSQPPRPSPQDYMRANPGQYQPQYRPPAPMGGQQPNMLSNSNPYYSQIFDQMQRDYNTSKPFTQYNPQQFAAIQAATPEQQNIDFTQQQQPGMGMQYGIAGNPMGLKQG